ncbi:MAG: flagellar basal-body rod protein FlgF [Clostridia bacterium]|nr:flagellar basal-body rod protein FlgF [Clostridia bacterium]
MLRGLHLAATGMLVQQLRQEVISNNLANLNTGGYKEDVTALRSFPEVLMERLEGQAARMPIGITHYGVALDEVVTRFDPGPLVETGHPTHLALVDSRGGPAAFFAVQVGEEVRYTRNGEFHVNDQGFLVTAEGYPVLGQGGPLQVGQGEFQVDAAGTIWRDGEELDRLQIVSFADQRRLIKTGANLFAAPPEAGAQEAGGVRIRQGWVEKANVNLVREMTDMLAAMRAYEASQKMIQAQDEALGKAVNEVGSLR